MQAIRSLDYVVLVADDPQALARFYTQTMGFPLHRDRGTWLELSIGSTLLAIRPTRIPFDPPGERPATRGAHLAFRVPPDDVDRWHRRLAESGASIVAEPEDREYGHRTVFLEAPEGNLVEIYAEIAVG